MKISIKKMVKDTMKNKIYTQEIDVNSTHILLKTDIPVNLNEFVLKQRSIIRDEINKNPVFNGYEKVALNDEQRILELMTRASQISNIGPMSAVAGSMSQKIGRASCRERV